MKKTIVILLAFCLCIVLCSCFSPDNNQSEKAPPQFTTEKQDNQDYDVDLEKPSGAKLSGDIIGISPFQHGWAIISVAGETDKNYCIDTNGNILFEINKDYITPSNNTYRPTATVYGSNLILLSDKFGMEYIAACNDKGELFDCEENGITQLYDFAAEDGYIITYSDGDTYKTNKMGLLNMEFEWIVEPSTEFAAYFSNVALRGSVGTTYYKDHKLYCVPSQTVIDVTTGNAEPYSYIDPTTFYENKPEYWRAEESGYYFYMNINKVNKTEMLSLGSIQTAQHCILDCKGACFVDDKAPVVLIDEVESYRENSYYFSLIDTSGNFVLDAVNVDDEIKYISISKKYIYVGFEDKLTVYTIDGEFVAEQSLRNGHNDAPYNSYEIANDVITFLQFTVDPNNNVERTYYCYNTQFEPLFS